MKIGELATRTGVSVRMLRYYEQEGLLHPTRRSSGYRDYHEDAVQVVLRIRMLGKAGLTLASIRHLLPCAIQDSSGLHPCPAVLLTLRQELTALDAQIACLQDSRTILNDYLATFPSTIQALPDNLPQSQMRSVKTKPVS